MYVALRRVDGVPREPPRWLDPHRHRCNSFYVFLGDGRDLSGLEGVVEIEDGRWMVKAPAAVMIPAGALHHYWLLRGSGWYFQITLSPTYEVSLLAPDELSSQCPRAARCGPPIAALRPGG
jgi:2-isopropylmalate synthase